MIVYSPNMTIVFNSPFQKHKKLDWSEKQTFHLFAEYSRISIKRSDISTHKSISNCWIQCIIYDLNRLISRIIRCVLSFEIFVFSMNFSYTGLWLLVQSLFNFIYSIICNCSWSFEMDVIFNFKKLLIDRWNRVMFRNLNCFLPIVIDDESSLLEIKIFAIKIMIWILIS